LAVRTAPTGRSWACLTDEGLLLYSLDESLLFDPFDLEVDVTPETIRGAIDEENGLKALVLSFRLNLSDLMVEAWRSIRPDSIGLIVRDLPRKHVPRLLNLLARLIERSPDLQLILTWISACLTIHGIAIKSDNPSLYSGSLRTLYKASHQMYQDLGKIATENEMMVKHLLDL